jgi:serine phosphatase RsbU (regulator of sigma subunit)
VEGTQPRPSSDDILGAALHVLTGCGSPRELLEVLAGLVVPAMGSWCLADLLEPPDLVTRVAALGPDGPLQLSPEMGRAFSRRSSAQATGLLSRLIDSPQGVLRLSRAQIEALLEGAEPRLRWQAEMAMALGTDDLVVVGIMSRNRPMGVITMGRAGGTFSDDETALLSDVAMAAGTLLDNFRLAAAQRNIAAALQTHLLPPLPAVPGLALTARYLPADRAMDVGGDWYDVFSPRPGVTSLVIGDATGHDIESATRMAEVRNVLRAVAVATQGRPGEVLATVDSIASTLGAEASATCVYAEIHHQESGPQLRWSSAGHLPPVLVRDGAAQVLDAPADLMLGVVPEAPRSEHLLDLRPGDRLLLYTDGLIETRDASLDDRITVLSGHLERLVGTPDEAQAEALLASAAGDDDVALLLVGVEEFTGAPGR